MNNEPIAEVSIAIDLSFLRKVKRLLIDASENSSELLFLHDNSLGRSTKKNLRIAEMYENEIDSIGAAVKKINEVLGDE